MKDKQIAAPRKQKIVICKFCGCGFNGPDFTEILTRLKTCKSCYNDNKEILNPTIWRKDESNKSSKK